MITDFTNQIGHQPIYLKHSTRKCQGSQGLLFLNFIIFGTQIGIKVRDSAQERYNENPWHGWQHLSGV